MQKKSLWSVFNTRTCTARKIEIFDPFWWHLWWSDVILSIFAPDQVVDRYFRYMNRLRVKVNILPVLENKFLKYSRSLKFIKKYFPENQKSLYSLKIFTSQSFHFLKNFSNLTQPRSLKSLTIAIVFKKTI